MQRRILERSRATLVALSLLALIVPAQQAAAEGGQQGDWELGLFTGGAHLDDYALQGGPVLNPDNGLLLGGRLGYFFTSNWSMELSYQQLSGDTDILASTSDLNFDVDSIRLNLLYNWREGHSVRPFMTFGLGSESICAEPLLDESETGYNVGAGARWFFSESMGVRIDLRYVSTDVGGGVSGNQDSVESTLGFLWAFGGGPASDEDGDGVPDKRDRCPGTPRGAVVDEQGCPSDADSDGVFDGIDKCPDTPLGAKVDAAGCPKDSDGDGVFDGIDKCPDTPRGATVDEQGCPSDADSDGVFDGIDQCPDTPRGVKVDAKGCPMDSDGDGVFDGIDQCPDTPRGATVDAKGCPMDSDGDGVFDGIDQCPGTRAGAQVNSVGCEVLFEEGRQTLVLEGVNFEFNSDELTELSEKTLDGVAGSLNHFKDVRVEVGGHTDSVGNDAYNMGLSQRRAESVRNYLIDQGVDGARLVAKGYGETMPVADNGTDEGRAKNRRVELKKID